MKAKDVLDCILYRANRGLNIEDVRQIVVPENNDVYCPQTEEWWLDNVGGLPAGPIDGGEYIMLYNEDWLYTDRENFVPDEEIELFDGRVYLYKVED